MEIGKMENWSDRDPGFWRRYDVEWIHVKVKKPKVKIKIK
jgi:hypothetical protein